MDLSDGTTIFAQLESMVKAYYKTWEKIKTFVVVKWPSAVILVILSLSCRICSSTAISVFPQPTEILEGSSAEQEVDNLNKVVMNEARTGGEDMDSNADVSKPTEPNKEQPQWQ